MPLLAMSTRLTRLTFRSSTLDEAVIGWLRLAPQSLRRLDFTSMVAQGSADLGHLRNLTSLYVDMGGAWGFPATLSRCTALRRLAVVDEDGRGAGRPLPDSISRLSRLELLRLQETGISSLPEGMSALRSLRVLKVDDQPLLGAASLTLPASLAALSGSLRVLGLAAGSEMASILRAFRYLREIGVLLLNLQAVRDDSPGSWLSPFSPAVAAIAQHEQDVDGLMDWDRWIGSSAGHCSRAKASRVGDHDTPRTRRRLSRNIYLCHESKAVVTDY